MWHILLQLVLQVSDLTDLAQSLLLQVCLKYFKLLFSHCCTHSQLRPLFLKSLHSFFEVVDLNKANMLGRTRLRSYLATEVANSASISFFAYCWCIDPHLRILVQ